MNRLAFIVLIPMLLLLPFGSALQGETSSNVETLFQEANSTYSRGEFSLAIEKYNHIVQNSGYSVALLLNLANSYAQTEQIGKAVVNYERALLLSPSDPDISGNLELIRKESGLFQEERSASGKLFHFFSSNQWAGLSLLSFLVLTCFQLASFKILFTRQTGRVVTFICVALLLLSATATYVRHQTINPSIVISPEARLLISPFETATSAGMIQEGRRIHPSKTYNTFTYVTDDTNRKGWIQTAFIESVCNPPL